MDLRAPGVKDGGGGVEVKLEPNEGFYTIQQQHFYVRPKSS